MLELPPNWRDHKERLITPRYFYGLAAEYEARGTRIIAGDRNRSVVEHQLSEGFLRLEEQIRKNEWCPTMTEWIGGFLYAVVELGWNKIETGINLLSPAKDRKRNEGFLNAFNEEDPQVSIVGDHHAGYLKSRRPDAHYTYFMTDSLLHHFVHVRDNLIWRRQAYDTLHISPPAAL